MVHSFNSPLITLKSYRSSIETDKHVFRWFLYLILRPQTKSDIADIDEIQGIYRRLITLVYMYRLGLVSCLFLTVYILVTKSYWLIIGLALLFICLLKGNKQIRKNVSQIGVALTFKNMDENTFNQRSLYQIGEMLARKYQVESLVAAISSVDNVMRNIMLFTVVVILFIHPLELWNGAIALAAVYYLSYMFLNVTAVYKNLIK